MKSASRYTVKVHRKDQLMTKIVNEESFTIGRSIDCAIPLSEDSISRVHLIVSRKGDQIMIEDKGSSNGTFVNEVRISQNTLVNVISTDRIRIGKSEYVVTIELNTSHDEPGASTKPLNIEVMPAIQQVVSKIAERPMVTRTETEQKKPVANDVFIHKIDANPLPVRPAAKVETPYVDNSAMFEGERILHEAHKKAAAIIYDGEAKAEKRVQAIYIQAREKQAEADAFYQKKISQAHKEADAIIMNFQSQGQELIDQAKRVAEEMRDEVDMYVQTIREKAKKEVEDILEQAREEAEVIKNETYEKALSKASIDAEDMVANAKAESQDILSFAKLQSDEMLTTARAEIQDQIKDLQFQAEEKQKALQFIRKEYEEYSIRVQSEMEEREARDQAERTEREAREKSDREQREAQLKSEKDQHEAKLKALKEEREVLDKEWNSKFGALKLSVEEAEKNLAAAKKQEAGLVKEVTGHQSELASLKKHLDTLNANKRTLETRNKELQEQLGRFQLDIQAGEDRKRQIDHDYEQQRAQMKARLEKENQEMAKESEERLQDAQLEIGKRMEKIEREMFDEIISRKDKIVKEVIVVVETRIAKVLEPAKWDQVSGMIFEGVQSVIEGKAVSFNDGTNAPTQSLSLKRKKKKEHLRWLTGGVVAGVIFAFGGLHVRNIINKDSNPMRTIANEESRRKQEDLERRKFNPPQVAEVKDTYVDSVIYTSGYVAQYQDPDFQQKLYKAASAYLLKTWRVDEDKSIQVLSIANALVKELSEKKEAIHPDFVKDGIGKMRALEKSTLERMKSVLGSEVRLESFRRFENKFYEQEVLKRGQ